jgi:hypothetical protein
MADFAARLNGCTLFSKLDLNKGYLPFRNHAASTSQPLARSCRWQQMRLPAM